MSAVLWWTRIKFHTTYACVVKPHDIASPKGLGTACVCLTQYAICCGGAVPPSVHGHGQKTLSGCCRSHQKDTRAMPGNLPESNGRVTWQRASVCSLHSVDCLTFRHRASCILGQAFHYSPENAFYIFNQQIYFII